VILDTKGNIFGAFTPVEWESRRANSGNDWCNYYKADPTLKSFLFTLKNPPKFSARRFPMKAEEKHQAIYCNADYGPCFCDIGVSDNCNTNSNSYTHRFGEDYTNDFGLDGTTFFTGSQYFQVKEIEVFEIKD
jgi:hypothetical protein